MNYPDFCGHKNKIVYCEIHSWSCLDCGFGIGCAPACSCYKPKNDPIFGTHIKEAIAIVKDWASA